MRIEENLSQAHLRLSRCCIEHLDWLRCIEKYDRPKTLFFCDPLYWQTEGYGVVFGVEQYQSLAQIMKTSKVRILVTINDHLDMEKIFEGFNTKLVDINYTAGGAGKKKTSREMLIMNW